MKLFLNTVTFKTEIFEIDYENRHSELSEIKKELNFNNTKILDYYFWVDEDYCIKASRTALLERFNNLTN